MSKRTMGSMIAFCIAVAIAIGVKVLPRMLAQNAAQNAAREAARRAAVDDAREVMRQRVNDAAKQYVRQLAEDAAANAANEGGSSPPIGRSIVVDRAAYSISLPSDSTVDPESAEIDLNHLTVVNLPDHATLTIVVIDDKKSAAGRFDTAVAAAKKDLEPATTGDTYTFDRATAIRSIAIRGTAKGQRCVIELGQIEGRTAGFVIGIEYCDQDRARTIARFKDALDSFQIK